MIIDCHVHVVHDAVRKSEFQLPKGEEAVRDTLFSGPDIERELPLASAEGVLESMDLCGIDKAIILGLPWCTMSMCRADNEYVKKCVERYPDRFIGFGVVQPRESVDALLEIDRVLGDYGFKGIKVKPVWQGFSFDDEEIVGPIIEKMIKYDAALLVHVDQLIRPPSYDMPYRVLNLKQKYPEARIICAHLGGLLCLYGLFQPVREVVTDLWYDTTIPATMKMVEFAVDVVPNRIVFGTDFPFNIDQTQKSVLDALLALDLNENMLADILWRNAACLLGLDV